MPKELADYALGMSDIDSYLDKQIKELEDTEYSEGKSGMLVSLSV